MAVPQYPDLLQHSECLFDRQSIDHAIDRLADDVNEKLAGRYPVTLNVPHGGLIFSGHLLPRLRFPLQIDYAHATRYRGKLRGQGIHWVAKPGIPLRDRTVLLLDDIFDEGFTMSALREYCLEQGAEQVLVAVLIKKNHARPIASDPPEFVALEVPDRYVFGFGMDYKHEWRNANGIYVVKERNHYDK